jgi:hypothetical protein
MTRADYQYDVRKGQCVAYLLTSKGSASIFEERSFNGITFRSEESLVAASNSFLSIVSLSAIA